MIALLVILTLFICLVAMFCAAAQAGIRVGRRRLHLTSADREAYGSVEAVVFGLMGLLLAFTFSAAAIRFENRRQLILEETNAMGTAYLRLDVLPPEDRDALRQYFRQYVDVRLRFHKDLASMTDPALAAEMSRLQGLIWSRAVAAAPRASPEPTSGLVLSSLNDMFDSATRRLVAIRTHVPAVLVIMLVFFAVLAAFLVGMNMATRERGSVVHIGIYAVTVAGLLCIVIDLEFPRVGLINVSASDRVMVELRQSFDAPAPPVGGGK